MSFSCLPTEILVKIFNHLSLETLELVEGTCARWSLIVVQNFFQKNILAQEYSIRKNYEHLFSSSEVSPGRTKSLYNKVHHELAENWRTGKFTLSSKKPMPDFNPGSEAHISSIATYKDKIYFGKSGSSVDVVGSEGLDPITVLNSDLSQGPEETRRPCRLCEHGSTLAVLGPNRTKVRIFNTNTDEMVGEIETSLGPIYHIAMSDKLLILLSGWTIFYWKIDSMAPERVRGQFQGSLPDFESDDEFQNWLEAHEVVLNSSWIVTRATRMRVQDEGSMRTSHFLHVRQIYPSGSIGFVLRPESSRLPESVYETTSIALSEGDLLAVGWRVLEQWVMRVFDLKTGESVFNTESTHFLSSVQIPLKWEDDRLFLKIIPVTTSESPVEPSNDEFGVSLGYLDMRSRELVTIPGIVFENSEDLLLINKTQIYRVNTKLERIGPTSDASNMDVNLDLERYALILSEDDDYSPVYSVTLHTYDFWTQQNCEENVDS